MQLLGIQLKRHAAPSTAPPLTPHHECCKVSRPVPRKLGRSGLGQPHCHSCLQPSEGPQASGCVQVCCSGAATRNLQFQAWRLGRGHHGADVHTVYTSAPGFGMLVALAAGTEAIAQSAGASNNSSACFPLSSAPQAVRRHNAHCVQRLTAPSGRRARCCPADVACLRDHAHPQVLAGVRRSGPQPAAQPGPKVYCAQASPKDDCRSPQAAHKGGLRSGELVKVWGTAARRGRGGLRYLCQLLTCHVHTTADASTAGCSCTTPPIIRTSAAIPVLASKGTWPWQEQLCKLHMRPQVWDASPTA